MNHQDALQEMAVERYLLGELSGASLDSFEEHLFECPECAADAKAGATFIDAARTELTFPTRVATPADEAARAPMWTTTPSRPPAPSWTSWFTNPWILAPALGACLFLLAIQTFVIQPRMKQELAQVQTPAVLSQLVLANAGARGDSAPPEIVAPEHGAFVISVDVPTSSGYSSYRCSLYVPNGSLVWQTTISPGQARDALLIHMPTEKVKEGLNILLIQGLLARGGPGDSQDIASYKFRVKIQK